MNNIVIATFYKFVDLADFQALQQSLSDECLSWGLKGTILLAHEGINGTIAGCRKGIDALLAYLKKDPRLFDIAHKESFSHELPFRRMKVRLKREIVSMGQPGVEPSRWSGSYVKPEDWNSIVSDPDVVVLDARNDYEVGIGTFEGAINPSTETFREFPGYVQGTLDPEKHKKVAMFCTGGIRCEKASAYLLDLGFDEVYQLQGGILKYLETVPLEESLWKGECFVFDDRVAVDHRLEVGSYRQCYACRRPLSSDDLASPHYQEGRSCPHCIDKLSEDQRSRFAERQHQIELARQRHQVAAAG